MTLFFIYSTLEFSLVESFCNFHLILQPVVCREGSVIPFNIGHNVWRSTAEVFDDQPQILLIATLGLVNDLSFFYSKRWHCSTQTNSCQNAKISILARFNMRKRVLTLFRFFMFILNLLIGELVSLLSLR
jgi:hypothetical protein